MRKYCYNNPIMNIDLYGYKSKVRLVNLSGKYKGKKG